VSSGCCAGKQMEQLAHQEDVSRLGCERLELGEAFSPRFV
jgi:hypothetical protein